MMKFFLFLFGCLICLNLTGQSLDGSGYRPQPRVFARELLQVKDANGNVIFDFTKSPCFDELGYNPDFSQQQNLASYKACEDLKSKEAFEDSVLYILAILAVGLIIWIVIYVLNCNKLDWKKQRDKYDTANEFKNVINEFFIADNISFSRYNYNTVAENSTNYDKAHKQFDCSYSYQKYLLNDNIERPAEFPNWFFLAYPDVTVWYVKNNINVKLPTKKLDSKYLRQVIDEFKKEYSKLELN